MATGSTQQATQTAYQLLTRHAGRLYSHRLALMSTRASFAYDLWTWATLTTQCFPSDGSAPSLPLPSSLSTRCSRGTATTCASCGLTLSPLCLSPFGCAQPRQGTTCSSPTTRRCSDSRYHCPFAVAHTTPSVALDTPAPWANLLPQVLLHGFSSPISHEWLDTQGHRVEPGDVARVTHFNLQQLRDCELVAMGQLLTAEAADKVQEQMQASPSDRPEAPPIDDVAGAKPCCTHTHREKVHGARGGGD